MLGRLKLWAAAAGAVGLAIASAFLMGRFKQAAQHKVQQLAAYKKTRKDIDNADDFDNVDDARNWLRQRKSDRDL